MGEKQTADLRFPIHSVHEGPAPLVIRTIVTSNVYSDSGAVMSSKAEDYVLFSALPAELQERVKLAIELRLKGY